MSERLIIVARIQAKVGREEFIKGELMKLIDPTRAERGCITYDLHQDNENSGVFLFYEVWESRELWQEHMNNDHLKAYMEATEGAVESFTINEMTLV